MVDDGKARTLSSRRFKLWSNLEPKSGEAPLARSTALFYACPDGVFAGLLRWYSSGPQGASHALSISDHMHWMQGTEIFLPTTVYISSLETEFIARTMTVSINSINTVDWSHFYINGQSQ
jgi:hypothetical protein